MLYYSKVLDLNPVNNGPGGYFVHYSFSFDSLDEFNTLHSSAQAKGWTVIQDDKKEYRTIKKYDTIAKIITVNHKGNTVLFL